MNIQTVSFEPTYRKDSGVWVYDLDSLLLPQDFTVVTQAVVSIPAQTVAGNHQHPREEIFLATSPKLVLVWLDEKNEKHELPMMKEAGELQLVRVPSGVPHAVKNTAEYESAVLLEWANAAQHSVERVEVI